MYICISKLHIYVSQTSKQPPTLSKISEKSELCLINPTARNCE